MRKLTPAQIAEEAVNMFIECCDRNGVSLDEDDEDGIERSKWQAVQETDGYELILPDDVQRLQAAGALLEACKAVVEEDGFRGSALMRRRIDQIKAAIALAEALPPAPVHQDDPEDLPLWIFSC
jgi:hypothetical protein